MKGPNPYVQNKQDRSDLNRSRRPERWGVTVTEKTNLNLKTTSVGIDDKSSGADNKTARSSLSLQVNPAHVLTRSRRHTGLSKIRQTGNLPLPPISRSRSVSGKVDRSSAPSLNRKETALLKGHNTNLPTCNRMKENQLFHVLVTNGKASQKSNAYKKISVALAVANKAAAQDSATGSRLIKRSFDAQPAATLTPAPVDPSERQKKNDTSDPCANASGTMMPDGVKHDASLCKARQQRDFCSDDSAIETESGDSEDEGNLERLREDSDDDEYYTDQRITEWVLKVNSSLFCTGNDEVSDAKAEEEQDVATIKIIYTGD